MSDMVFEGLIPEYSTVIIDEAHHLEEAATNQFGFELPQGELERIWEPAGRLCLGVRQALADLELESGVIETGQSATAALEAESPRLRETWGQVFAAIEGLHASQRKGGIRETRTRS